MLALEGREHHCQTDEKSDESFFRIGEGSVGQWRNLSVDIDLYMAWLSLCAKVRFFEIIFAG